ncbi:MAG TPA: condensation domain-containing protein, partial [Pyrinomonadaceae bacterium]
HSAVRLEGQLNIAALERSFAFLVHRHETLRTTFELHDGQPIQVISPQLDLIVEHEDVTESALNTVLETEASRPFDLATGPLLRVKLLHLGTDDHVLSLTMHHIVSDGWSMSVLIGEIGSLYEAFSKDESPALPELPIQYADFARWQHEWLNGDVLATQLDYWKKQLDDVATLKLPTDHPRPLIRSHRGSKHPFTLPRELALALIKLARTESVTLFTVLLAAWQTLLLRYTGQTDVAIGTPIANRNRFETEALIGFFVNTLVLRTDLSRNPTFRELLERVFSVVLDAQAHQEVPFEKIVEEMQLERSLSYTPLFQVMFALHNAPVHVIDLPEMKLFTMEVARATARFDLTCELFERGGYISGAIEYSTELFDAETITRLLGHYERLLSAIAEDPDQRILELPFLTDAEERQLLYEWNEVAPQTMPQRPLHALFEEQVKRDPEAVAVVLGDERVTYGELNERADKVANRLRRLGVGPETIAGIFIDRSVELVVAVLGILKAGGAYLPLDIELPKERIAFMLDDARPAVIL